MLVDASGVRLNSLMSLHVAGKKVHDADESLVFTVRRGQATFTVDVGKLGVPAAQKSAKEDKKQ